MKKTKKVALTAVALAPTLPAIVINLESMSYRSPGWLILAVVGVLMGAGFVEAARRCFADREFGWGLIFALSATIALTFNMSNALTNASHVSDSRSDARQTKIETFERRSGELARLIRRREEQVKIAGEQATEALEAAIQRMIAADSRRWQATHGCTPQQITAERSKAFCAEIAGLQGQHAAAVERDKIDRELAVLNSKVEEIGAVPSSANPLADRVAGALEVFGVSIGDGGKRMIAVARDWLLAVFAELLACLGPSAVLKWSTPRAGPDRAPEPPKAVSEVKQAPPPPEDPIVGFISAKLERFEGSAMPAGEMWALWGSYCAEVGCDVGTQKRFTTSLKQWVTHERKNNRPRWVGVKVRGVDMKKEPRLRVVSSEGASA